MSNEIHRRPTHWRMLLLAKYCPLRKTKIKDPPQKKKSCQTNKILQTGNSLIKLLRCKHEILSRKSKNDSEDKTPDPEIGASSHRASLPGLEA